VLIQQPLAVPIVAPEGGAARMTAGTGFDLNIRILCGKVDFESPLRGGCRRVRRTARALGPFDVSRNPEVAVALSTNVARAAEVPGEDGAGAAARCAHHTPPPVSTAASKIPPAASGHLDPVRWLGEEGACRT
jgi:hypothetical protein